MTLTSSNGSLPQSFTIADFDNDNPTNITACNSGTNNIAIFLGYGNIIFKDQITYLNGSSPLSIAVGNFNNDNFLDIIVANRDSNNVVVLLGFGNDSFEIPKEVSSEYGSYPFSVVVVDFNNEKKLDFAVGNYNTDNLQIQLHTY